MQEKDYIIVGSGLAGSILAHQLHKEGKRFIIISNPALSACSRVAAGICNPVVFFRITKSYMVDQTLPFASSFYREMEEKMGVPLWKEIPLAKIFSEEREKALWEKRREEGVGLYLGDCLLPVDGITGAAGAGLVKKSARMNGAAFLDATHTFFQDSFLEETFEYDQLEVNDSGVVYKQEIKASSVIFCEGYKNHENPWFGTIGMKPVKGDVLTIRFSEPLPAAVQDLILTKSCFLMPLDERTYKAGATYNWTELNDVPDVQAKAHIMEQIRKITTIPFEVTGHEAGVRPASADRRPVLGTHPQFPALHIFNGLGTKGMMLGPYFGNMLVQHLVHARKIIKETDVKRMFE